MCARALGQVLELDSCTSAKFSRHLIVPNAVFRDTRHAGAFVRALAAELPPDAAACVDLGVYTRLHTHTHTHAHTHTRIRTRAHARTRTHTRARGTHAHTHTHTHAHARARAASRE